MLICFVCTGNDVEKGRAFDGRRAYRCRRCGCEWTNGIKGKRRYSVQRVGHQFANTGASKRAHN